ncbi:flagellar FlbD family protein [Clostridium massiliamazoniense]|uniref:flagellar FlbD family protein n=1 Tax=Clostridium massiliamazoniense TaxID=1347366 RepID=UPI0006D8410C|nr:flagellar FlbD family protein [Clostridium massiliamazoniense]
MIRLIAMNNQEFFLNPDHIEKMESVPETVLTLSNGRKYIVNESPEEIIRYIVEFKKRIFIKGI